MMERRSSRSPLPVSTPPPNPDRQERRDRARERRGRELRRQRAIAVTLLLCAVAGVAVLVTSGSSPDGARKAAHHPPPAGRPAARHGAQVRTASTPTVDRRLPRAVAVPILTYHVIAAPPPGARFPGLYVPEDEFEEQIDVLARAGFHGVTLDEVHAHWTRDAPLPSRPIVLTFDNGYRSQYIRALPALRRLGWRADENLQLSGLPPAQGGLTRKQVRGLVAAGWELDTQGFTHADLVAITPAQLHHEVADARALIQRRYGVAAHWFCYPSGHYDARVVRAVRAAGYTGSTTTITGWARATQDPFRLERIRALNGVTGQQLLQAVQAARRAGPPPDAYS